MEYLFELGTFPQLSLSEIVNILQSSSIPFTVINSTSRILDISMEEINPSVFIKLLGGTRSITDVTAKRTYRQKIKDYQKREFNKPYADLKSGLLPSKLAKMLINLSYTESGVYHIYDPFCGGGTIITEASVMGIKGTGSDIETRTIAQAKANATWIADTYKLPKDMTDFFVSGIADVPVEKLPDIDAIITEPYMGNAASQPLAMIKADTKDLMRVNTAIVTAFTKASQILAKGKRLVIIIPRYRTKKGMYLLPAREQYSRYGFKKVDILDQFNIDKNRDLLYFRLKAVVQREIFILEKI